VRVGQHARARGAQRQRPGVEAIVERGEEVVERGREETIGALDGLVLHA
jgi:hypothetical protein